MKENILWAVGGLVLASILFACVSVFNFSGRMRFGPSMMWGAPNFSGFKAVVDQNEKMFREGKFPQGGMFWMMQGESPPEALMRGMTTMLKGKIGDELDKAFLQQMILHHQGAVEMAKLLKDAKHEELKKFGEQIISAQSKEIKQMQDWQKAWYK